jgi:hypothetical protein
MSKPGICISIRNPKLHPCEIITLALLKRLKGHAYRRFLVWLKNTGMFPNLPNYTRLCRLFKQYRHAIGSDFPANRAMGLDLGRLNPV